MKQALILAAGRGARLDRPGTPKPLVDIGGQPIIIRLLKQLEAAGTPYDTPLWRKQLFSRHLCSPPNALMNNLLGDCTVRPRAPTLLVIEDSQDQAILFAAAARRARPGLDVRNSPDGLDGITYLAGLPPYDDRRAHPAPDLILLDLIMPEVDGFEVLTWIMDRPDLPTVPVVVLTASVNPHDERRALALGATAVYRKPNDLHELTEVVRAIVDQWIAPSEMIGAHIWAAG